MTKEITSAPNPNLDLWGQGRTGRAQQDILAWTPALRQADDDHAVDMRVNRARAREMSWQEPYGVNALRINRDSIVGKKYALSLKIDADGLGISEEAAHEWEENAEKEWERYAEGAWFGSDASRKDTFTGLIHQVLGQLQMEGEALGLVVAKQGWEGYHTCVHVLEPERLEDPPNKDIGEGLELRNGVEIDRMGEPLAYYVRRSYPASGWRHALNSQTDEGHERVPRFTDWGRHVVLHCFDSHRPSMTRGVSTMVSVMKQMKMLGAYSDTELERATMQASFAATIESDIDYEQAMRLLGAAGGDTWGNNLTAASMQHMKTIAPFHQQMGLKFNGSRVAHLLPGEKLNVVNSNINGAEYDKFEQAIIRQLAAGLGVATESLSRDFSDTSYSAARMSLADIWRSYLVRREIINKKWAMPHVACWLEEAILNGFLDMPDKSEPTLENWVARRDRIARGSFISWGKPVIDPVKEMTGKQMSMSLGLTTLEDEAASEGKDWSEVLKQRAQEKAHRDKLGLNQGDIDPTLAAFGAVPQKDPTEGKKEGEGSRSGGGTAE